MPNCIHVIVPCIQRVGNALHTRLGNALAAVTLWPADEKCCKIFLGHLNVSIGSVVIDGAVLAWKYHVGSLFIVFAPSGVCARQ